MIKEELPEPLHRFKDEIGEKKRFATGGLLINNRWVEECNYLFSKEYVVPITQPKFDEADFISSLERYNWFIKII